MRERFITFARTELTEHLVYAHLAGFEKHEENRAWLEKLSAQELEHYKFWQSLIPEIKVQPYPFSLRIMPLMRRILGVTFSTKFLESNEKRAIETYKMIAETIPEDHRAALHQIIEDEKTHEQALIGKLQEKRVAYIGFIALGLADAIVEITGVHAGFLGITGSTLIAGVSGIIVGTSAAISMGSAAYIQAKQDTEKSAIVSGFATGLTYLASVILLAMPYFFVHEMLPAFVASTTVGVALLAAFTFYSAVVFDRKFWREFGESTFLMLVTALITFILGKVINDVFHISAASF